MMNWATIIDWLQLHGLRILVIIIIGIGLYFGVNRVIPAILRRNVIRTKGESKDGVQRRIDTLGQVFTGTAKFIIIAIVAFMMLSEVDIDIRPILASLGIAGIAVGFGAQYLVRDLIAGFFIIMENQYRVGDVAKIANIAGLVESIGLRKTVLRDLDGIVHHVPNGEIRVASNYSRHFSRVNLDVSVAYGTNLNHAIEVINRVGHELAVDENWSSLIKTEPQVLRVNNLGDSGIDIKVLGEVKPLQQWAVAGELRKRIKEAFDEENIEIPWPHTKVYFGNEPESHGGNP
jgi:moderate conductance mechanosensitive channel